MRSSSSSMLGGGMLLLLLLPSLCLFVDARPLDLNALPKVSPSSAAAKRVRLSEVMNDVNSPSHLADIAGFYETRMDNLPLEGASMVSPWAGWFWPTLYDSINSRWAGKEVPSPAAKYATAFGLNPAAVEDEISLLAGIDGARNPVLKTLPAIPCSVTDPAAGKAACDTLFAYCNARLNSTDGKCLSGWNGVCHGWGGASIVEPEPQHTCVFNGVTFEIQDVKALLSFAYVPAVLPTSHSLVGGQCMLPYMNLPTEIRDMLLRDINGRPVFSDCRDVNPAALHLLLTNFLGRYNLPLLEDRTFDMMVWNQPVFQYEVLAHNELTKRQAIELTVPPMMAPMVPIYPFNANAKYFVNVTMRTHFINESPKAYSGPTLPRDRQTDVYGYVLELDAQRKVIGGEYIGASVLNHPDFIWLPPFAMSKVAQQVEEAGGLLPFIVGTKQFVMSQAPADSVYGPISLANVRQLLECANA